MHKVSFGVHVPLADTSGDTDNTDSGLGYGNRKFYFGPTSYDCRHIFIQTYTLPHSAFSQKQAPAAHSAGRLGS
ncbi:MAG: hypothetical protein NTW28_25630 [Candidatus Solibacter sp.]|nr:hypothetical protein [Candidatus Solibacter sp.]